MCRDTLDEIHKALPWPRQRLPSHRAGGDPSIVECWRIDATAKLIPVPTPPAATPAATPTPTPVIAEDNANEPIQELPAAAPPPAEPASVSPEPNEAAVSPPEARTRKPKEPVQLPEGDRRFLVFRRVRNERMSRFWSVSIRMPNGYTELIDTATTDKLEARNQGSIRVIRLYKELGLERPSATARKAKVAATAAPATAGAPPPGAPAAEAAPAVPRRRGLPAAARAAAPLPAPPSIALARRADAGRLETAYAAGLGEIAEALLMQEDQNPEAFIRHVRDVVAGAIRTARHGGK